MGVYSVNPDATVYIKTTNSWYDPEGEKQAAVALINEGCDVIGQHCDTPNPQLAAEEGWRICVGYNSDMSKGCSEGSSDLHRLELGRLLYQSCTGSD